VVHDGGNGAYSSCFTGQPVERKVLRVGEKSYQRLDYHIGLVTVDSNPASRGIYTYDNYPDAVEHADGTHSFIVQRPAAVLEVKLLKVEYGHTNSIYVVKKVWPEEEEITSTTWVDAVPYTEEYIVVTSTFKVGDYVMVNPDIDEPEGSWGNVSPGEVGRVTKVKDFIQVKFPSQEYWQTISEHLVHAERLAPTEEWVDVTKEAKLNFAPLGDKYYLCATWNGEFELSFWDGGIHLKLGQHPDYRVDGIYTPGCENNPHSFYERGTPVTLGRGYALYPIKVLHRVITEYPV